MDHSPPANPSPRVGQREAQKIIYCSAGFAAAGGLSASGIALWKHAPAIPAAFRSATNTGLMAFTFFSLREYLVIPAFSNYRTSSQSIHADNLLESGTAGFGAGAAISAYFFRSLRRMASGGFTFSLAAIASQIVVNEANVMRIKYLRKQRQDDGLGEGVGADHLGEEGEAANRHQVTSQAAKRPPLYARLVDTVLTASPIRKISDEEYVATLREKIAHGQQELRIIDGQLKEAQTTLEQLTRQGDP